jgi:DNA-binding response OmpR family regulator
MERKYRVLIIDNDNDILASYQNDLTQHGLEVETASDGVEGLEKLRTGEFDVAIVEVQLAKINGIEISRLANEEGIETDIVILTANGKKDDVITAINIGVKAWFEKSRIDMPYFAKRIKEVAEVIPLSEMGRLLSAIPIDVQKNNFTGGRGVAPGFNNTPPPIS